MQYRNGQELWLKLKKDQGQKKNTISKSKRRAVRFHKPNISFWVKGVLQPKS